MGTEFHENVWEAVLAARQMAAFLGQTLIDPRCMVYGLSRVPGLGGQALRNFDVYPEDIRIELNKSKADIATHENDVSYSAAVGDAFGYAKTLLPPGAGKAGSGHVLIGLLEHADDGLRKLFLALDIDLHLLRNNAETIMRSYGEGGQPQSKALVPLPKSAVPVKPPTPNLDKYGCDLVKNAHRLLPTIGRQDEIDQMVRILSRKTKPHPCLVGEAGVGKTAIVEGLAQRIALGKVPARLAGKRIVSLDLAAMVAGTKYRGEFEQRLKDSLEEAVKDTSVILFIDEIHMVLGAGAAQGAMDAAGILKPQLSRGELRCIGATTLPEYRKIFEKDGALSRRFQRIDVAEPDIAQAIEMVQLSKEVYATHHKVRISNEAVEAAVHLSARYLRDRYLPDKAFDVIDDASATVSLARGAAGEEPVVSADDIADVIQRRTKIPVGRMNEDQLEQLLKLPELIRARVVGQKEAVDFVVDSVQRGRCGFGNPDKPIGSFLFLGPTGVGKTELARALAVALFGTVEALVRFDMSEYQEKHSAARFIGAPPGYVGYQEGGQLTEAVFKKPYCVLLLDEIEKAHRDVLDVLLQVFDDGRLTDGNGRTFDFRNTIIIMTSNAGNNAVAAKSIGGFAPKAEPTRGKRKNAESSKDAVASVTNIFRREFLNRLRVAQFSALTQDEMRQITDMYVAALLKQYAGHPNEVQVEVDDATRNYFAVNGYDSEFGARPLQRLIEDRLSMGLTRMKLEKRIKRGSRVRVTVNDGELAFDVA